MIFLGAFSLFFISVFIELFSALTIPLGIMIILFIILNFFPPILYKACKSLCGCTCFLLFANAVAAIIADISYVYFTAGKTDFYFKNWIIIYSVFWISFSLLAETQVAKLANEIVSGVTALFFTLLSYYISLLSDNSIFSFFSSLDPHSPNAIWQVYEEMVKEGYSLSRLLFALTGVFLPFIGLSCISTVILSLKQYWIQKYNKIKLFEEVFDD